MEIFLGVLAFSGLASVGVWYLQPEQKMRRMLRRLTPVEIAKARDGRPVVITGKLGLAAEPLTAPFTGRPCAAYRLLVEEQIENAPSRVLEEVRASAFYVRDATGKAHVLMNESMDERVVITLDRSFDTRTAGPPMHEVLGRHGHRTDGLWGQRKLLFHEGVLEEGEEVVVAGAGRWELDTDPDARHTHYREVARVLVMQSTKRLAIQASDSLEIRCDVARAASKAR